MVCKQVTRCGKMCKGRCEYTNFNPAITYTLNTLLAVLENSGEDAERWAEQYMALGVGFTSLQVNHLCSTKNVAQFLQNQYTEISERNALTVNELISQFGGHLGLFIGASKCCYF